MTTDIAGLPFWEITFDADGDPDIGQRDTFLQEVRDKKITDLLIFSHGWNNDQRIATELYTGFFGILANQLSHVPAGGRQPVIGLAGVIWPSQLWSDQPIPDFPAAPGAGGGGAASLTETAAAVDPADPTLDEETLAAMKAVFPEAVGPLDKMAALLKAPPTKDAQAEFYRQLQEFSRLAGVPSDDGELTAAAIGGGAAQPRMLKDGDPTALFERYRDALQQLDVPIDADDSGGQAGLRDIARGIWNGAKEALRGATYWQMKNRAGVVGRNGLGPVIGLLHQGAPDIRVHLIGHSFGARLVSYALAGLPQTAGPSPVKAVTLLQGAFSHFAFAQPLPFDAHRSGALAGMLARIDGPLTVCFSTHDSAVGTMYPLASIAAGDDSAGADDLLYRWGGMGADGAQGVQAELQSIRGAGPGTSYHFAAGGALNIDASDIVRAGGPPAGAHSDIVHPELTWVVLTAGRIA